MSKAFPIITGSVDILSQENLLFGYLKYLTDSSITKAKPDFYDKSRPAELDKHIREELSPYIVLSTNTIVPYLPNFFTEGKGPNKNAAVYKRQALYDGTLGAREIYKLRSYTEQETLYDNNAYAVTSTYHDGSGTLTVYTTHPIPSKDPIKSTEYRMTQLRSFAMTDAPDTFRQGAGALRNARDWAKEKRKELIATANDEAPNSNHSGLDSSTQSLVSLSSNESTHPESETSADELAQDNGIFAHSSHKTPVGARTNPPPKASEKASRINKTSRRP